MAYSDFREKMSEKRAEAEQKYLANSGEAWEQIKKFFTDPTHWIVAGIALMLALAGFFTVKFIGSVRAPTLNHTGGGIITLGGGSDTQTVTRTTEDGEEIVEEVIDDSNTEQPMLSGARKKDYYTFLLFGTDKFSGSTDTIMIVSYDVANQKLNLMSIPRDTMVNVSWDIKKINSVYSMSGLNGLKKHIGKLIGFVPDYYVKIDLQAFVDVVNLLGGVEFDVPISMHYHDPAQGLSIDLEPGLQTLDGEQAMGLVRFRKSDRGSDGRISGYDDTGRVATQQAFLQAMFKQCLQIRNWTKITGYVEIFNENVESDLTLGNMLWFARQAMNLGEDGFTTVTAPGNYYASAWSRSIQQMQSYVTLYPQQMIKLVNQDFNPYLSNVTMANLDIMSINSDGSVSSSTGYVADSRAAAAPVTSSGSEASNTTAETPAREDTETPDTERTEPTDTEQTGTVPPDTGQAETPPDAGDTPIIPIESLIPTEPIPPTEQVTPVTPLPETGTTTDTTPTENGDE